MNTPVQHMRLRYLLHELIAEHSETGSLDIPEEIEMQKLLFRALCNVREPRECKEEFLRVQNEYLQEEIMMRGILSVHQLKPAQDSLYLWRGDITVLACDAIVNAANENMLGCFQPNHHCIDNTIHSYAGIQLRQECKRLMDEQGHLEPTGQAKITDAYNLPARYIIHTVGPIVEGTPTKKQCEELASCYTSCLELAEENKLESIAFCCIATGAFGFPNQKAAKIALESVKAFLPKAKSLKKVVFNVFTDEDEEIYKKLLHVED